MMMATNPDNSTTLLVLCYEIDSEYSRSIEGYIIPKNKLIPINDLVNTYGFTWDMSNKPVQERLAHEKQFKKWWDAFDLAKWPCVFSEDTTGNFRVNVSRVLTLQIIT